jgi:hypothetical protein
MADIHPVPDPSMMVPEQSFTSADLPDLSGITAAAEALAGPGGPRQAAAEHLLSSPQGFAAGSGTSGFDMTDGFAGGWPQDVQPPSLLNTPDQGSGDYPGTV